MRETELGTEELQTEHEKVKSYKENMFEKNIRNKDRTIRDLEAQLARLKKALDKYELESHNV